MGGSLDLEGKFLIVHDIGIGGSVADCVHQVPHTGLADTSLLLMASLACQHIART